MYIKSNIKCVCGFSTPVTYKKPGILSPTYVSFDCSGCGSKCAINSHRAKDKEQRKKGMVFNNFRFIKISETLVGLMTEESKPKEETA